MNKKIFMETINRIINGIDESVFPSKCFLCGQIITEGGQKAVCGECIGLLSVIEGNICGICGMPVQSGENCGRCAADHYAFHRNRSLFVYDDVTKELIHNFKYNNRPEIGRKIVELMFSDKRFYACIQTGLMEDADCIVPVPLHKEKEKIRGFNQAEIIAKHMAKNTGKAFYPRVIIRKNRTAAQNALSRPERGKNVKDAFVVIDRDKITGKNILLIDDIFTTGSTVNECAKTLLASGAVKVCSFTIAKTLLDN